MTRQWQVTSKEEAADDAVYGAPCLAACTALHRSCTNCVARAAVNGSPVEREEQQMKLESKCRPTSFRHQHQLLHCVQQRWVMQQVDEQREHGVVQQ